MAVPEALAVAPPARPPAVGSRATPPDLGVASALDLPLASTPLLRIVDQSCGACAEPRTEPRVLQRVLEKDRAVALDRPDVVSPLTATQRHREYAAAFGQDLAQRVRELDLARRIGWNVAQRREHPRPEHVTGGDRKPALHLA